MSKHLLNAEQLAIELFNRLELTKSTDFYLALSGGQDSCVLLDLMCKLAQSQSISLTLLHFDHGLQAQSALWAKHCEELAARYDVPIVVKRQTVQVDPKKGLEASARTARYAWFADVINEKSATKHLAGDIRDEGAAVLLTAHHANDQAETLLINLMRGTGVSGLRGIARKKNYGNYTVVRPLLDFDQQQITDYAQEMGLHWIEDPSNQEEKFRRNAIRKNVLPTLNSIKSDAVQQFVKSADHMVATERLLADLAILDLQTVQQHPYCPLDQSYGINLQDIQTLGKTVGTQRQANALRYWLQQNGYSLNSQQNLQQLIEWSNHGTGEKSELRNGDRVYRTYRNNLFVMPLLTPTFLAEMVWQNLSEPLTINLHDSDCEIRCTNSEKAQQHSNVQVLFAEQARRHFSLKKRFQTAAIPHWRRDITPILVSQGEVIGIVGSARDVWLILEG